MSRRAASLIAVVAATLLSVSTLRAADSDLSVNARLLASARNADVTGVDRALKAGASPNARNRLGETALLIALKKNDRRWRRRCSPRAPT